MLNLCQFSEDRTYRYSLVHQCQPGRENGIAWIGLNPSTADETKLDPTLRRIRAFSRAWGYSYFVMLNLFAWRATSPKVLKRAVEPIGPDNDYWIQYWLERVDRVILGWGNQGTVHQRDQVVCSFLEPGRVFCLQRTAKGQPKHPLYLAHTTTPIPFYEDS